MPGRGTALCGEPTRAGTPCCDRVVLGFGTCLHHVRPDQLEAAEAVVGFRLCRTGQCRQYAISYTDPPACKIHCSGFMRRIEYRRYFENVVRDREAEIWAAFAAEWRGDRALAVAMIIGGDRGREWLRAMESGEVDHGE